MQPPLMKPEEIVAGASELLHALAAQLAEGTGAQASVASQRSRQAAGHRTYTIVFGHENEQADLDGLSKKLATALQQEHMKGKLTYGEGKVEVSLRNEPTTLNMLHSALFKSVDAANRADMEAAIARGRERVKQFHEHSPVLSAILDKKLNIVQTSIDPPRLTNPYRDVSTQDIRDSNLGRS